VVVLRALAAALALIGCMTGEGRSETRTTSNEDQLRSALKVAQSGDTIVVRGRVILRRPFTVVGNGIVIEGEADPFGDPPSLEGTVLRFRASDGLAIRNLFISVEKRLAFSDMRGLTVSGTTVWVKKPKGYVLFTEIDGLVVEDTEIDGPLRVSKSANVDVRRVAIGSSRRSKRACVDVEEVVGIRLTDVEVIVCTSDGIAVEKSGMVTIERSFAHDCGGDGIQVISSRCVDLRDNRADQNSGYGFLVSFSGIRDAQALIAARNVASNNARGGIFVLRRLGGGPPRCDRSPRRPGDVLGSTP
jgi:hypothetical protein